MHGIRKGESRAGEPRPREPRARTCARCGRLHSVLGKKMGTKSGCTLWNLVFLLTVSCVKGRSAFGGSPPLYPERGETTRQRGWRLTLQSAPIK